MISIIWKYIYWLVNTSWCDQSRLCNEAASGFHCILALKDVINKNWNTKGYQGPIHEQQFHHYQFNHFGGCWQASFSQNVNYRISHMTQKFCRCIMYRKFGHLIAGYRKLQQHDFSYKLNYMQSVVSAIVAMPDVSQYELCCFVRSLTPT